MRTEDGYVRHHLPIILDVPEDLAQQPVRSVEILNLICMRITEAIEHDSQIQAILRRHGIDWGWEKGTWEP